MSRSDHPRVRAASLAVLLLVGSGVASACSDDGSDVRSGSASGSASGAASGSGTAACDPVGDIDKADTTVAVVLDEWSVKPTPGKAPAGLVGFDIDNKGSEAHELVVVKGAPASLPTDADGALDEDKLADGALIGEVEAFPAGESCTGAFDLTPGQYSLVCNLVETVDGKTEAHMKMGMVAPFTVT